MPEPQDEELWSQVDRYLNATLISADAQLQATLAANAKANLPTIDVSPTQGKFLHMLAKIHGAKRILEIGTLGGYSTIWLARALPADGKLISLEFNPKHANVASENVAHAGLSGIVEIKVGAAAESLARLFDQAPEPFDMIFIDADKPNNPVYLEWAMKLSRRGTVLIVDNVIREGKIVDGASKDASVVGTRAMFAEIAKLQQAGRLTATAIQTVGSKGYDGLCIAIVR